MEIDKIIKKFCIERNMSLAELSRQSKQPPQSLSNKLARKDLKVSEFEKLLQILKVSIKLVDEISGEEFGTK